ncbi:hypothetical protein TEA_016058 [Camellia sinensis var. sinensis]|uniref:PRA1 family protein n=1 Tax=Camellia sinensis var. sinensis TaxID=542762 RepID=A0A4S4ECB8_CAMSN|nr:hypothetical protein TEA_016058 [Camellia sinensis var. sinensis]
MDWSNETAEDLIEALREVDYYGTNYFIMIVFILGLGFLRRPLTIIAAAFTALSVALLNDSFAGTFNEKVTRTVRKFSPHLAARMRPPLIPVIRGRPSAKRAIYISGQPRWVFVLIFSSASFILGFVSCGLFNCPMGICNWPSWYITSYLGILVSSEASAVQSSEFGLCSGRCNEIISMVVMLSA